MPRILIIAGPNGAGKTTFAEEFLPKEGACPVFVNADNIAKGLSPFQAETMKVTAGRLMLELLERYSTAGESFAFETTLSGTGYVRSIREWRTKGYEVWLCFLSLPSAEVAIQRVANRVREGGHHTPTVDIERRFTRGLDNFHRIYVPIVDHALLFDATELPPKLIKEYGKRL